MHSEKTVVWPSAVPPRAQLRGGDLAMGVPSLRRQGGVARRAGRQFAGAARRQVAGRRQRAVPVGAEWLGGCPKHVVAPALCRGLSPRADSLRLAAALRPTDVACAANLARPLQRDRMTAAPSDLPSPSRPSSIRSRSPSSAAARCCVTVLRTPLRDLGARARRRSDARPAAASTPSRCSRRSPRSTGSRSATA